MRDILSCQFSAVEVSYSALLSRCHGRQTSRTLAATVAENRVNHFGTWQANLLLDSEK